MTPDGGGVGDPAVDPPHDPDTDPVEGAPRRSRRQDQERRRIAEIFGDVLPESTRDDQDESGGQASPRAFSRDAEIARNVPPHHT